MTWARWIRTVEIAAGIDPGGVVVLGSQIEALMRTGCRIVHVDVADELNASVAQLSTLAPLVHRFDGGVVDLHLTEGNPLLLFGAAAAAGADSVTFETGAVEDVRAAIQAAHDTGLQAGVALGPADDPEAVAQVAQEADLVLCAGHEDGLVSALRHLRLALPSTVALEVEGPIVEETTTMRDLYEAGARVFVVREPIFSREDLPRAYRRLVQELA
jgi:pentose-5-phosphate-3-epimerase